MASTSMPCRRGRRRRSEAARAASAATPYRARIQTVAAATVSSASSQSGRGPIRSETRAATTDAAPMATVCWAARWNVRRAGCRIRTPATVTETSWTASAGPNPQASAIAKVKQMDGRMTELARRLASTYGRASTTTASAAISQYAVGSRPKVSDPKTHSAPSAAAAGSAVTISARRRRGPVSRPADAGSPETRPPAVPLRGPAASIRPPQCGGSTDLFHHRSALSVCRETASALSNRHTPLNAHCSQVPPYG